MVPALRRGVIEYLTRVDVDLAPRGPECRLREPERGRGLREPAGLPERLSRSLGASALGLEPATQQVVGPLLPAGHVPLRDLLPAGDLGVRAVLAIPQPDHLLEHRRQLVDGLHQQAPRFDGREPGTECGPDGVAFRRAEPGGGELTGEGDGDPVLGAVEPRDDPGDADGRHGRGGRFRCAGGHHDQRRLDDRARAR